jgi:hypothetical protein
VSTVSKVSTTESIAQGHFIRASRGDVSAMLKLTELAVKHGQRDWWESALDFAQGWELDARRRRRDDERATYAETVQRIMQAWDPSWVARQNPQQLQILENRGRVGDRERRFKRFHKKDATKESSYVVEDGSSKVTKREFLMLGRCPEVTFTHQRCGECREHEVVIEGDPFQWFGHRIRFLEGDDAVLIEGDVQKLREWAGTNGRLGLAPSVTYFVPWKTFKGDGLYIHQFGVGRARPKKGLPALVFDDGPLPCALYVGGAYEVGAWFDK